MKLDCGLRMVAPVLTCLAAGCATLPPPLPPDEETALRSQAVEGLKRAVRYRQAASLRAAGIEAMQRVLPRQGLPWIRNGLHDESEAVRFAAILALGGLGDKESYDNILGYLDDENPRIRVAVYYALHRLGDTTYTARLPELLLEHSSPLVRRDTTLVFKLLGEPGAIKLLARAMKDKDDLVVQGAMEAMAALGSTEAVQQLTFAAHSGVGMQEVAALNALADLADPKLEKTFRYSLETGQFIETRLAAARGLALLGRDDGMRLALRSLIFNAPQAGVPSDPPREQIMRVRQLAAAVLGTLGDRRALGPLREQLNYQDDPRVQLAAAAAILEILGPQQVYQDVGTSPPFTGGGQP